jgi:HD-GYP domain-containing protein (c-di-GMP phosphodiesterase class II)
MDLLRLIESTNFDHSKNVSRMCGLLAKRAGYSIAEADIIEQLGLLHDIGKTGIPVEILLKPGPLTEDEFEIVKTHTQLGRNMIGSVADSLQIAARTAYEHHERVDGGGYLHLTGSEIHPYSKLIAVCDVFDALYSKRSYKSAWSIRDISQHFREQAGKHFDGSLVEVLFDAMEDVLRIYALPAEQGCQAVARNTFS